MLGARLVLWMEWQIVRADDGRILTIPPITPYQRLARGPD